MKQTFYCWFLLWMSLQSPIYSNDLENLPQYEIQEGESFKTEEYAIKEQQRLERMKERYIQLRPKHEQKIILESIERLFRWHTSGTAVRAATPAFQTYQVKLINQHPEWVPWIFEGCARPIFQAFSLGWDQRYDGENRVFQPQYFNSLEILPYHEGCTWENSRATYRLLVDQYRTVRQFMNHLDWRTQRWNPVRYENPEGNPGFSTEHNYFRWMMQIIPGVLARFPAREGVEELCQQMEAYPGWNTLAAANALSVCTSEETLPRVKKAFETAQRISREIFPDGGVLFQMPLEYKRLEARLADVKADLTGMMEGAGFRLIKPDWSAARDTTWNQLPPLPTNPTHPAHALQSAETSAPETKTLNWNWALLLLVPVTWLARGAWDRSQARGSRAGDS